MSKSAKNDNRPAAKNDNQRATATGKRAHPWADAIDGIDYGPAVAAVADLAEWAFGLAAADVADWAEGQRRVRTTQRYVLARLRGKRPRGVPFEDILFTAGLLARIFEAEVGLGMTEMVSVLDQLGLPTEVVPMVPRIQPHTRIPVRVRTVPSQPRAPIVTAAPCEECGHCPRYRNAA